MFITICDPMEYSPQAPLLSMEFIRIIEWVAIYFSTGAKFLKKPAKSHPSLFRQLLNLANDPMERSFCYFRLLMPHKLVLILLLLFFIIKIILSFLQSMNGAFEYTEQM